MVSRLARFAVIGGTLFGVLQVLGRTSGTTRSERTMVLPGDDVVPRASLTTTHATTFDAPPGAVWPWLIQMGWHQGGWYTSPWVDRVLFPANWPAANHIIPDLQARSVGDFIPDGAPETGCGFIIERMQPEEYLVLHSTTHLPLSLRRRGASLDWTWTFHLTDLGAGRTRFVFRTRGTVAPLWIWLLYQAVIVPADFVMAGQMMRGLARRVGSDASAVTRP